ncbi:hypothetical protein AA0112_g2947 [Alternaria arborescens]|nr:hypothetical protein AA0112_g2947 [Alternaria arborescens]
MPSQSVSCQLGSFHSASPTTQVGTICPHKMRRNSMRAPSLFCSESCTGNLWLDGTDSTLNPCRQGIGGYYITHCVFHDVNSRNKLMPFDLRTNTSAHVELKASG